MVDMGYRFRIYPNRRQRLLIERTFGCTRWVWNHFLNKRQVEYEETGRNSRAFRQMKDLPKLKDANPWLREVDSVSLQAVIQHLDRAYDNFYRRVASKKKGGYKGTTGYPRFKGKHNRHQSYTTKNVGHTVYVADDKHVRLPKLGMVKTRVSRPVTGVVKSATVSRNPAGEYYVTIKCAGVHKSMAPAKGDAIGIDLGLKDYCITSEGVKHPNHRYLKQSEKRLRHAKRKLSRKPKGGNNREKQRIKVARLEQKVARQRRDTLDKLSTMLVRRHPIICMETLMPKNMVKKPQARQTRQRRGVGRVRAHARLQGRMVRSQGGPRGQVLSVQPALPRLRIPQPGGQEPRCARMDMPAMRRVPRPGCQRGQQPARRGAEDTRPARNGRIEITEQR